MKIIKPGKQLGKEITERRFKCPICECVFSAEKDEYKVNIVNNPFYFCECPNCKNNAFEVKTR